VSELERLHGEREACSSAVRGLEFFDLSLAGAANKATGGSEEVVAKSLPVMVDDAEPVNKSIRSSDFEPLLDVSEAAGLLRIHPKTLQKLARFAHVPAYRVGRFWRYRASDLEMWLRSGANSKRQPADGVDFTEEKTQ
jgi:excisionase family DNA binding protein